MKVTKGTIDRIWHHWEIKEWGKNLLDFDQMSVVVLLIDWLVDWQDRRLVLLLHAPLQ